MPKVTDSYLEEKREFIVDCTRKVLENKSFRQITMRDVIRETGFSQGAIYKYYNNLEEILNVIICDAMKKMKTALKSCLADYVDFDKCYKDICNCMIKLYEDSPEIFEAMLKEVSYCTESDGENNILFEIYQVGEELNDIIITLLQKGIDSGIVKPDLNLNIAVFYMWSGIGQIIIFSFNKQKYIEQQFGMKRAEYMEQSFDLIIRSIKNEKGE